MSSIPCEIFFFNYVVHDFYSWQMVYRQYEWHQFSLKQTNGIPVQGPLNFVFEPMSTEILRKETCLDLFTFSASFLSVCTDEPYRGRMIWIGLMAWKQTDTHRETDSDGRIITRRTKASPLNTETCSAFFRLVMQPLSSRRWKTVISVRF